MTASALLRRASRLFYASHSACFPCPRVANSSRNLTGYRPHLSDVQFSTFANKLHYRLYSSSTKSATRPPKNFYELLGVSRNATNGQIKKAYYVMAKNHHPDKVGGDQDIFAQVNQAYETLSDAKKRRIYDLYGEEGVRAAAMGAEPNMTGASGFPGGSASPASAEEILREFTNIFGGEAPMSRRRADDPRPGGNRQTSVTLTLREVANGVLRQVSVDAEEVCTICSGSGKKSSTVVETCATCQGKGVIQNSFGLFQAVMDCQECSGSGSKMRDPCGKCDGRGVTPGSRETSVSFPPGCDSGMVLRVAGGGDAGVRQGPAGDLYVKILVLDDPYFHRNGMDLHVVAPISFAQAALGGSVTVNTLEGEEKVSVKSGTQSDDVMTLRGRALRGVNQRRRGDQMVHFKVIVPDKVSGRQKELLEEMLDLEGGRIEKAEECQSKTLLARFQKFLRRTVT